jgi:hypothetical protein
MMMTGNCAKYLLETNLRTARATGFDEPGRSRMSSQEARRAAASLEHPLWIILRWLTPARVRAAIDRRRTKRHFDRAMARLSHLSPHLLDDVGVIEVPSPDAAEVVCLDPVPPVMAIKQPRPFESSRELRLAAE